MMKTILKNKLEKKLQASMVTYVMIMFGMIVVFYLLGFQSPYLAYTQEQVGPSGEKVTEATGIGTNILDWMNGAVNALFTSASENPLLAVLGTVVTIFGFYILSKVGGQFALTYIIPILILGIFINIFVFPTASLQGNLIAPFDLLLFGFLNLFFILSVIEFVRGSI